ncbi:MAG: 16S rRNA (guanine(966)-N(2))-methyltransferase RsmD [Gammaproteobacteria bacterium]|nr:16S rRNA (guanine(966)-N(2))-methyltransferase RsmD [Gammaproteobacteria bacterium]
MTKPTSELRIIGGTYRSRKIIFSEEPGLRPTHNRIRETVFNWLQDKIENSDCLDVFAGSGAMGFEALSRGAKHVTFIDISKNAVNHLKQNSINLKITNADFYQCDFMLQNPVQNKKFDVVFLDPPFQNNLLLQACELLASRELLNPDALIYLEFEKSGVDISQLPKKWEIKKHKNTQMIEYLLAQKQLL